MEAKNMKRAQAAGDAQGRRRQTAYEMEAGQRKRLLRFAREHAEMKSLLERWVNEHMHKEHPALTDATLAILTKIKGA